MRFRILGSGSSGNSALLLTGEARVLVDAGFSPRKLKNLLAASDQTLDGIDAIFITHEHGDHTSALEGLADYPNIQIFANAATARAVQETLSHELNWNLFETGNSFRFRDLEVRTFAVPHDAHDPVGYHFSTGWDGDLIQPRRGLLWLTDLGHVPNLAREHLKDCDVAVVESNHCPRLLQANPHRSWSLKRRISGRHGHLSNEATRELLASVASPRWRRIYLTHLSRDCNSPDAVSEAMAGLRASLACEISVVGHGEGTDFFDL